MMIAKKSKYLTVQLCYDFMNDLNYKDVQQLQKWFRMQSTVCVPPTYKVTGNNRILAMFRAIFKKYDVIQWQVREVFTLTENRFIIFSDSHGKLKSNVPYCNRLVTDISFDANGQISHLSDYFKNTTVFSTK